MSASARTDTALALSGGGFFAFAGWTGLVAGMLRVRAKLLGKERVTLHESKLLDRFGTISSNSGASWFMAELAYSARFRELVEDIAASEGSEDALFEKGWVEPWLQSFMGGSGHGGSSSVVRDAFEEIAKKVTAGDLNHQSRLTGLAQDIHLLGQLWRDGLTWDNFVSLLLESTAGISRDAQLGAPVEAWAKGKVWLVAHSMVAPSHVTHGTLFHGHAGYTRYQMTSRVPVFIPATFSVVLGEGSEASAPVPYCAKSALPPNAALAWSSSSKSSCWLSLGMCGGGAIRSEPLGRCENLTERADEIRQRVKDFETLAVPEDSRILRGVKVGTLEVTTARCDPFGIEPGRRVQLHVLSVNSSVNVGVGQDFRDYAVLLGQLVREFSADLAMPENSAAASRLVEMLMGDA